MFGRSRAMQVAAVSVVGALALVGCGSSSSDGSPGETSTTLAASSGGPGAEIVPGVEVADGSRLLGTTFPGVSSEVIGDTAPGEPAFRTLTALIAVDGDPGAVFDQYVRAVAAAGYGPKVDRDRESTCAYQAGDGGDVLDDGAKPADFGEEVMPVGCRLSNGSASVELMVTGPSDEALWSSVIVLRVHTKGGEVDLGQPTAVDPALLVGDRSDRLPDAGEAPAIPISGERLAPSADWTYDPADPTRDFFAVHQLTVPEGLELITPSATISSIGSWATVGRTEGDPTEVMQQLVQQAGDSEYGPEWDEVIDGHRVIGRSWDEAGGDKLYLTAVESDDGWFVLVETSTDP